MGIACLPKKEAQKAPCRDYCPSLQERCRHELWEPKTLNYQLARFGFGLAVRIVEVFGRNLRDLGFWDLGYGDLKGLGFGHVESWERGFGVLSALNPSYIFSRTLFRTAC